MKRPTFSLVIICYNEEKIIASCLDAIAVQTVMPDEVIVVDNNCTDRTAEIAQSYPFVTLISEKKQGMIPARERGFSEAKSEILGRIDADTRLSPTWTAELLEYFTLHPDTDGVSGPARLRSIKLFETVAVGRFITLNYYITSYSNFGTRILWGSNMALKREAWFNVKDKLCNNDKIVHEDQDLSLRMAQAGYVIGYCRSMLVSVDSHKMFYLPTMLEYIWRRFTTSRWHWQHDGYRAPLRRLPLRIVFFFVQIPGLIVYLIGSFWYTLRTFLVSAK